eukprot:jgi/Mesvir1/13822/Mv15974-RA.1
MKRVTAGVALFLLLAGLLSLYSLRSFTERQETEGIPQQGPGADASLSIGRGQVASPRGSLTRRHLLSSGSSSCTVTVHLVRGSEGGTANLATSDNGPHIQFLKPDGSSSSSSSLNLVKTIATSVDIESYTATLSFVPRAVLVSAKPNADEWLIYSIRVELNGAPCPLPPVAFQLPAWIGDADDVPASSVYQRVYEQLWVPVYPEACVASTRPSISCPVGPIQTTYAAVQGAGVGPFTVAVTVSSTATSVGVTCWLASVPPQEVAVAAPVINGVAFASIVFSGAGVAPGEVAVSCVASDSVARLSSEPCGTTMSVGCAANADCLPPYPACNASFCEADTLPPAFAQCPAGIAIDALDSTGSPLSFSLTATDNAGPLTLACHVVYPDGTSATLPGTTSGIPTRSTFVFDHQGPWFPVGASLVSCVAVDGVAAASTCGFQVLVRCRAGNSNADCGTAARPYCLEGACVADDVAPVWVPSSGCGETSLVVLPQGYQTPLDCGNGGGGGGGAAVDSGVIYDGTGVVLIGSDTTVDGEAHPRCPAEVAGWLAARRHLATDNVRVTHISFTPTRFGLGQNELVFTAVDSSGNDATCPAILDLRCSSNAQCDQSIPFCDGGICKVDSSPPSFDSCGRYTTTASSPQGASVILAVTAADNVALASLDCQGPWGGDGGGVVTADSPTSQTFTFDGSLVYPIGETPVTCTAVDNSGNEAHCSFVVDVNCGRNSDCVAEYSPYCNGDVCVPDAIPPVWTDGSAPAPVCKQGLRYTISDGRSAYDCSGPGPACPPEIYGWLMDHTVVDNVAVRGVSFSPTYLRMGNNTVTFRAVDGAMNAATCTANIEIANPPPAVVALEVNQAVQSWDQNVTLVRRKDTLVRAFVELQAGDTRVAGLLSAQLVGYIDGLRATVALEPINLERKTLLKRNVRARRASLRASINFLLPPAWVSGSTLRVCLNATWTSDGTKRLACGDGSSGGFTRRDAVTGLCCGPTLQVRPVESPCIRLLEVWYRGTDGVVQSIPRVLMEEQRRRFKALLPISSVDADIELGVLPTVYGAVPPLIQVNYALDTVRVLDNLPKRCWYVGVLWGNGGGLANSDGETSAYYVGKASDPFSCGYARNRGPHEFLHNLNISHAFEVDPDASINRVFCSPADNTPEEQVPPDAAFPYSIEVIPGQGKRPTLGPLGDVGSEVWGADPLLAAMGAPSWAGVVSPRAVFSAMGYCQPGKLYGCQGRWIDKHAYEKAMFEIDKRVREGRQALSSLTPSNVTMMTGSLVYGADGTSPLLLLGPPVDACASAVAIKRAFSSRNVTDATTSGALSTISMTLADAGDNSTLARAPLTSLTLAADLIDCPPEDSSYPECVHYSGSLPSPGSGSPPDPTLYQGAENLTRFDSYSLPTGGYKMASADFATFGSFDFATFASFDFATFPSFDLATFASFDFATFGSFDFATFGSFDLLKVASIDFGVPSSSFNFSAIDGSGHTASFEGLTVGNVSGDNWFAGLGFPSYDAGRVLFSGYDLGAWGSFDADASGYNFNRSGIEGLTGILPSIDITQQQGFSIVDFTGGFFSVSLDGFGTAAMGSGFGLPPNLGTTYTGVQNTSGFAITEVEGVQVAVFRKNNLPALVYDGHPSTSFDNFLQGYLDNIPVIDFSGFPVRKLNVSQYMLPDPRFFPETWMSETRHVSVAIATPPDGTDFKVQVAYDLDDSPIASFALTKSSPQFAPEEPIPLPLLGSVFGEASPLVTLCWQAKDADGDRIYATIQYCPSQEPEAAPTGPSSGTGEGGSDGGLTQPVRCGCRTLIQNYVDRYASPATGGTVGSGSDVNGGYLRSCYVTHYSSLQASLSSAFRVYIMDGLRSAEAFSAPFEVQNAPPRPFIFQPLPDGTSPVIHVVPGTLLLDGRCQDATEGEGVTGVWTSVVRGGNGGVGDGGGGGESTVVEEEVVLGTGGYLLVNGLDLLGGTNGGGISSGGGGGGGSVTPPVPGACLRAQEVKFTCTDTQGASASASRNVTLYVDTASPVFVSGCQISAGGQSDATDDGDVSNTGAGVGGNESVGGMESVSVGELELGVVHLEASPGLCGVEFVYETPTAVDDCDANPAVSRVAGLASGDLFPVGTTRVTHHASDVYSGNVAACSFDVVVADTQPPTLTCPGADVIISASADACVGIAAWPPPTATDNCGGLLASSTSSSPSWVQVEQVAGVRPGTPLAPRPEPYVIAYRAVDASGNVASCSFNVFVVDDTPPVIVGCPSDGLLVATTTTEAAGEGTIMGSSDAPSYRPAFTAWDACTPGVQIFLEGSEVETGDGDVSDGAPALVPALPLGVRCVRYYATDAAGNTGSCPFVAVISSGATMADSTDATSPPSPPALSCQGVTPPGATSAILPADPDTCSLAQEALGLPGAEGPFFLSGPEEFTLGKTMVYFRDAEGTSFCVVSVEVADVTPPVVTCPADVSVATAPGTCASDPVMWVPPTVTDNCVAHPEVTRVLPSDPDLNLEAQALGSALSFSSQGPLLSSLGPGDHFPRGSSRIAYVATDRLSLYLSGQSLIDGTSSPSLASVGDGSCGRTPPTDWSENAASCSFTVTVTDREAPIVTCPAETLATTDPGTCTHAAVPGSILIPASATDNCDDGSSLALALLVAGAQVGGMPYAFARGVTPLGIRVTDLSGNSGACETSIRIRDAERPVLVCPGPVVIRAEAGVCGAYVARSSLPSPVAVSDNCEAVGDLSVSAEIRGTVVSLSLPGTYGTTATGDTSPTSQPESASAQQGASVFFPLGQTEVTVTATDASGNHASCVASVTVIDQEPPSVTCPPDQLADNAPGACSAPLTLAPAIASDNCDAGSLSLLAPVIGGAQSPVGSAVTVAVGAPQRVTYSAVDGSGNAGACETVLTVRDVQPPEITCPTRIVAYADATCRAVVATTARAGDNCRVAGVAQRALSYPNAAPPDSVATPMTLVSVADGRYEVPSSFALGDTILTSTATDASGNSASCTTTVTVLDAAAPLLTCPGHVSAMTSGSCSAAVTYPSATVSDNCGGGGASGIVLTYSHPSGSTFPLGLTMVSVAAKDLANNAASCVFTVNVTMGSSDRDPMALVGPSAPRSLSAPALVRMTGLSCGAGSIYDTCRFDWGNGTTSYVPVSSGACTPAFAYAKSGQYEVKAVLGVGATAAVFTPAPASSLPNNSFSFRFVYVVDTNATSSAGSSGGSISPSCSSYLGGSSSSASNGTCLGKYEFSVRFSATATGGVLLATPAPAPTKLFFFDYYSTNGLTRLWTFTAANVSVLLRYDRLVHMAGTGSVRWANGTLAAPPTYHFVAAAVDCKNSVCHPSNNPLACPLVGYSTCKPGQAGEFMHYGFGIKVFLPGTVGNSNSVASPPLLFFDSDGGWVTGGGVVAADGAPTWPAPLVLSSAKVDLTPE